MANIQTGSIEPIEVYCFGGNLPLTGLTNIYLSLRRLSDGLILDWSDNTFKTEGVLVAPSVVMTEVSSTLFPGNYKLSSVDHPNGFDTSKIINHTTNERYSILITQVGLPQNVESLPSAGEIIEGTYVDDMVLVRKDITNRKDLASGKTNNWILYDDDSITPLLTWDVSDPYSREIQIAERVAARRTKAV